MLRCTLLLILIIACAVGHAQCRVLFCEEVDDEGRLSGQGTEFKIDTTGGEITMYLLCNEPVSTSCLDFKLFKLDEDYNEEFVAEYDIDVAPDFMYIWTPVYFTTPGLYAGKVYNRLGDFVSLATVYIKPL